MFCTCMRSCARANDVKIMRSRDAQCNTMNYLNFSLNDLKVIKKSFFPQH